MRKYLITWYTKQNGLTRDHSMTLEAGTARGARARFDDIDARKAAIMGPSYRLPHKFGVTVRLAEEARA